MWKSSAILFLFVYTVAVAGEAAYDPLVSEGSVETVLVEFTYDDREVPLKLYLPEKGSKPAPVILFSHGLGGSRKNNAYVGNHWAGRGYVVVAMQHAGSDEAVWKNAPRTQRMTALRKAANGASYQSRVKDVVATLDQLEKWNAKDGKFANRFDLEKVGMSGHSFGAVTTQAVSGQSHGLRGQVFTDKRIDAALAFSPSIPQAGDAARAFGSVSVPWMLMTGTQDKSAIGRTTPEKRRKVFQHVPGGNVPVYELVLDGAEHMAFSDRTLRGGEHRNPNHHKAIKALSSAFWDTHLREDEKAKAWLQGEKPEAILADKDVWQRK